MHKCLDDFWMKELSSLRNLVEGGRGTEVWCRGGQELGWDCCCTEDRGCCVLTHCKDAGGASATSQVK